MDSFALQVRQQAGDQLEIRLARALAYLVSELWAAYDKVTTLKGGNATGSLTYEVKRSGDLVEAIVGPGEAGKYLMYLEFGERGTQGSAPPRTPGGGGHLYQRTKAPSVLRDVWPWLRRSGIPTPQFAIDIAAANARRSLSKRPHPKFDANQNAPWYSKDPSIVFSFFIAMKRKKFGRAGLRVLERTVQQQTARMQEIING